MPELSFLIRWPDGAEERCYSPSTVVAEHLAAGRSYALDDFVARCRVALTRASDRVEARYGHRCALAQSQLAAIETRAERYRGVAGAEVGCLAMGQASGAGKGGST